MGRELLPPLPTLKRGRDEMKIDELKKLSQDLHKIGIEVTVRESFNFHILNIANMDFYFYKDDTKQYDGWGTGNQEIMKDLGFISPPK